MIKQIIFRFGKLFGMYWYYQNIVTDLKFLFLRIRSFVSKQGKWLFMGKCAFYAIPSWNYILWDFPSPCFLSHLRLFLSSVSCFAAATLRGVHAVLKFSMHCSYLNCSMHFCFHHTQMQISTYITDFHVWLPCRCWQRLLRISEKCLHLF